MDAEKSELSPEEQMQHAKAALASGESQRAYAAKLGVNSTTLAYWIRKYRASNNIAPPRKPESSITILPTGVAQKRIEELEAENRDLRAKMASLQNVVLVLGHQLGE